MKILLRLIISAIIIAGLVVGGIFVYNNYFKKSTNAFQLITDYHAEETRLTLDAKITSTHATYTAIEGNATETRFDAAKRIIIQLDNISIKIGDYLSITKLDRKDVKLLNSLVSESEKLRKKAISELNIFTIILTEESSAGNIANSYNDCYKFIADYILQYNKTISAYNDYVVEHHYAKKLNNLNLVAYNIFFDIVNDAYSNIENHQIKAENLANLNKFLTCFNFDTVVGNLILNDACVGDIGIAHPYVSEFINAYNACDQSLFATGFLTNLNNKVGEVTQNTTELQKAIYYFSEIVGVA